MQWRADKNLVTESKTNHNNSADTLILGLGNILLKDEGVGVHIAAELQKRHLPDNVEVIDGGTAALDVLLSRKDLGKLVIVDALTAGKEPGTIYKKCFKGIQWHELIRTFGKEENCKISLHQAGLIDALAAAEKLGCTPKETVVVGVEPGQVDYGAELTEPVKRKFEQIINTVLEEVEDAVYTE